MEAALVSFILGLGEKYPWAVTLFIITGVLRTVFKPLVAFARTVVLATPSVKDDEILNKAEGSKAFKAVAWLVDYLTSIKLPGYDIKK